MNPEKPPIFPPRPFARLAVPALLVCAVIAAACGGTGYTAQYSNGTQPFTVHAISGTPLDFGNAIDISTQSVVRVDGSFAFDVAFDIDTAGRIVLLPVTVVGQNPSGNRSVGIQVTTQQYDAITQAPLTGYMVDTATVVSIGQAAIVQAQENACSLAITPYMYAKLVVDSIDRPTRTIYGRALMNINCGFRMLTTGIPGS